MSMNPTNLHIEYESTPAAWCAYEDPEGIIGRGKTRELALIDLHEQNMDAWATEVAKLQRRLSEETQDTARLAKFARLNKRADIDDDAAAMEAMRGSGSRFARACMDGKAPLDAIRAAIDAMPEDQ